MHFENLDTQSFLSNLRSGVADGGLTVTQDMKDILDQPGLITLAKGSQKLRKLYSFQSMSFDATRLSPFGFACFFGRLDLVQECLSRSTFTDLNRTETPYEYGYATLIISGSLRVQPLPGIDHLATLRFLIPRGLNVDIPDIAGWTALHHVVIGQSLRVDLLGELLKSGANVDHQNRYGEVPLFGAYQKNYTSAIELLLEYGADLDIPEANGLTPRQTFLKFGPKVTAVVQKWIRKRNGQEAPRNEKQCNSCGRTDSSLKNCARCHVARYCSVACQSRPNILLGVFIMTFLTEKDWGTHKKSCQPFSADNIVAVKPHYEQGGYMMPLSIHRNRFFGVEDTTSPTCFRTAHIPKNLTTGKIMVIKVQLPYDHKKKTVMPVTGPLFVYNKNHDFVCQIRREDGATAYDCIRNTVSTKGVGGAKAYFAAELKAKDEMIIKVSQVLAEQPF
ncbi:hypothetical protein C0992_003945 [Termitomyces sp. T32_za158]|nr:hypothetical protein C0992_003945 [Termitomyces sp. T32_za158]